MQEKWLPLHLKRLSLGLEGNGLLTGLRLRAV